MQKLSLVTKEECEGEDALVRSNRTSVLKFIGVMLGLGLFISITMFLAYNYPPRLTKMVLKSMKD